MVSARDGTAGNRRTVGRLVGAGAVAAALLLGLATPAARAAGGRLFQLTGPYGCVSDTGAEGCATGRHLHGASSAAVSPDGRNVYVASNDSSSVTTFLRQRRDGKVVQPASLAGCVSEAGRGRCATGRGLLGPFSVAVSADGANVYVASLGAVAAFARNPTTGTLTQLPGAEGCLSEDPGDGCGAARGLGSAASVAVSPDGHNVYVAAVDSNAVAVFARNSGTGALTQLAGAAGCMSEGGTEGCSTGRGLHGAFSVALSPSGAEVYVSSLRSNAVAVLPRNPATGALTQLPGTAGCLSEGGTDGCASARGLTNPNGIAVSPDGGSVYVAASGSNALAAFKRQPNGTLSQSGGANGCVSERGGDGCARGHALAGAFGIAVSPDARNVYVASLNAVVGFSRNPASGVVRQLSGAAGCVSEGGEEGCSTGRALTQASSVALDPRGVSAYVTAYRSAALATFARNPKRGRVKVRLRGMRHGCTSPPFRVRVKVTSLLPLRRVRVYLDGRLVGTSRHGRLIVRVRPRALRPGVHKLRVKAADVTGTRDSRTGRFRRC